MQKIILAAVFFLCVTHPAHAFINLNFPDFFGATAFGFKGATNFDKNLNGSIYGDLNFTIFTLGVELGYVDGEDRFNGKRTGYDYSYVNPYFGLHLPISSSSISYDIYANVGPLILGNSDVSNSNYNMPSQGTSVELGIRAILFHTHIILGTGFKGHYFSRQTEDNGGHYRPDSKMLFLNLGYYWNWK